MSEAVERGVLLYTRGEFFAAHEAWEERWREASDGDERRALQGLIQVAAGYFKIFGQQRGEAGARLLRRGADKLAAGPAALFGLALAQFADAVRASATAGGVAPLLRYQGYYCEENAALLCRHPALAGRGPALVFVRAAGESCVLWAQRVAEEAGAPVLWDYHVFVLTRAPWQVWDLDTTLGCPAPAADYLRRTFRPELRLPPAVRPRFRVVPAAELAAFASDRSHMRGPDGAFTQPPPPWPPLGEGSTLARFLALDDPIAGEEHTLASLIARVTHEHF